MNYKSDSGYLAIGVQVDATTPVIPDVFVPLIEEGLTSDPNNERVEQIVGINWKSNLILQGNRTSGGTLKINADPDSLGHFLNMTMAKGSTTGTADGYTHPFTIDTAKYYTIDILKGNYIHRFVGCQISKLGFAFENGNLQLTAEVMAKSKFNYGTVKTALAGAGEVAVVFDELFDPEPCKGLVAGDVIQTWVAGVATDIIIATVSADHKSITCAATEVTAGIGSLITLKKQTASYSTLQRPFRLGQALLGVGADETAATANAGSYALATPTDEIALDIDTAIEERFASGDNDPILLAGIPDATLVLKKLFELAEDVQQWNDITKKAITIIMTGDEIANGTYASLTIKLHNVKPSKVDNKLNVGDYVYDETEFMVEYDDTDSIAMEISLVNATAGSNY